MDKRYDYRWVLMNDKQLSHRLLLYTDMIKRAPH